MKSCHLCREHLHLSSGHLFVCLTHLFFLCKIVIADFGCELEIRVSIIRLITKPCPTPIVNFGTSIFVGIILRLHLDATSLRWLRGPSWAFVISVDGLVEHGLVQRLIDRLINGQILLPLRGRRFLVVVSHFLKHADKYKLYCSFLYKKL